MNEFLRRNEKYVAGVILALIVLILIYSPDIFPRTAPASINVPLCKAKGLTDYQFIETESKYVNVPDYDADIFIMPTKQKVDINSNAEFSLKIVDKGIQKLNSTYFYIFLYDSDNQLRGIFPCFCGETEINFEVNDYRCYGGINNVCDISSSGRKLTEWTKISECVAADGQKYHCTDRDNSFLVSGSCRSRSSLINGFENGKQYIYSFNVDKIGTWKIHAYIFEKEYQMRNFGTTVNTEVYNNPISQGEAKFEVVRELPPQGVSARWYLSNALNITCTFVTALGVCNYLYNFVKVRVLKYKYQLILFLLLVISFILLSYHLCKIACPIHT